MNEENEKKKEFLKSYQKAKRDVARLEQHLREWKLNKILPSVIHDGMPHGTNIRDLSDYAAQVDKIEREIIASKYERIYACQKVQRCIEAVEDEREKDLLTYRYLEGKSWEQIAMEMGYTSRHILRLHGRALENLKMS
ncbi:sigma factor-like helix-turn-helix DNA-binding protein [Hominifimenecus sp. rT4P-3]|uniref:sigma factor-like helix-turn-helix DNA-binding protein n=1 Tax=Hominifimenecus sp. rT4P-3 TaxID=3242979 RepID=UPI003DA3192C